MRPSSKAFVAAFVATASLVALPVTAAPAVRMPVATTVLPGSNATLYGLQDGRLPRIWYHLYLEAGERFVPARHAGLSSVAADLLDLGPAQMTLAAYRQDLFHRNAEIAWEATNRFLIAHVKCRPEQLTSVTALVRQTALAPRLDETTFKQTRDRIATLRQSMDDNMQQLTFHYAKQRLWDFRPESRLPEGWAESLRTIQRDDMAAFLHQRLRRPAAFVAAAGPATTNEVAQALGPAVAGWLMPFQAVTTPMPAVPLGRRVLLIDKPGATDNQIYVRAPLAVDPAAPAAFAAEVFFAGMGYDLGARLGKALRVERGLTYHAGSGLVPRAEWPCWYAYTFGGMDQTPKLLAGVFELFAAAKTGLTAQEVERAKDKLLQAHAADMETPPEQLEAVANAVGQGLPADLPFRRPQLLAAVKAEELAPAAAAAADLGQSTLVIMGDASKLSQPLRAVLPPETNLKILSFADLASEALAAP